MMNIYLACLIIALSFVIIIDYLDAPNEIAGNIMGLITKGKITHVRLNKPFGCSLCMTFWTTLILLLIVNPCMCWLSLIYAICTKYIFYLINLIDLIICKSFIYIENKIRKK